MQYKVSKQYLRGGEIIFAAFSDLEDAKNFIQLKLKADAHLKVKVTYRIIELGEAIFQFGPDDLEIEESQNAQGKGNQFRPTPLNTAPRPAGTPAKWIKDEDEEVK